MGVCAKITSYFFIQYPFDYDSQLQLVYFNRAHYNETNGPASFRLMKNHKINFFESPNPRHFNFHNLNQGKYYLSEDAELNEDGLFTTPLKTNPNFRPSPTPNVLAFPSCLPNNPKKKLSEDISQEYSQDQQHMEQQPVSFHEIKEKIDFSHEEEELLIPITPLKTQLKKQEGAETTVRRQVSATASLLLTPASENRAQRGLKKLAAQAYRFVIHQKKTSYKQVARKLIEQLGDEGELDINRRGEMNIKRRVYDALNVLIALGLLKRNGNRLMIKRQQIEFETEEAFFGRERQRRRELALQEELAALQQTSLKRQHVIEQKRKLLELIILKTKSLKQVVEKNKMQAQIATVQQKISFPLLVMSQNRSQELKLQTRKENKIAKQMEEIQAQRQLNLKLWQDHPECFNCSFTKRRTFDFLGELDLLALCKAEGQRDRANKVHKIKRNR